MRFLPIYVFLFFVLPLVFYSPFSSCLSLDAVVEDPQFFISPDYVGQKLSEVEIMAAIEAPENSPTADRVDPITPDITLSGLITRGSELLHTRPVKDKMGLIEDVLARAIVVDNKPLAAEINALMASTKTTLSPFCVNELTLNLVKAFNPFTSTLAVHQDGVRVIGYGTRCDSTLIDCNSIVDPITESDAVYLAIQDLFHSFHTYFSELKFLTHNQFGALASVALNDQAIGNSNKMDLLTLLREQNWLGAGFTITHLNPSLPRGEAEARLFISQESSPCVNPPSPSPSLMNNLLATEKHWKAKLENPRLVRPAQLSPPQLAEPSFWESDTFYGLSSAVCAFVVTLAIMTSLRWVYRKRAAKTHQLDLHAWQEHPYHLNTL